MRPANRFALAAGIGLAASAVAAAWWSYGRTPVPAAPSADQVQVDPLPGPSAGDPGPEKVDQMLDRIEAAETEKLGPVEAKRRRAPREKRLDLRLHGEHHECGPPGETCWSGWPGWGSRPWPEPKPPALRSRCRCGQVRSPSRSP